MFLVAEISTEQEAPPVGGAAQRNHTGFRVCAFTRGLVQRCAYFDALVVLAQDDVNHAADRVGAVDGRSAVGEDLDAFNGRQRDNVEVNRLVGGDW